jgi:hypothetical protein
MRRGSRHTVIRIEPFTTLPSSVEPDLQAEADDIGRFLDTEVALDVSRPS